MIPSHGLTHSVLLLAVAADLSRPNGIAPWVRRAREFGAFLTAATDLAAAARTLIRLRLAFLDNGVAVNDRLLASARHLSDQAPSEVARLLLIADPPIWLHTAVADGTVMREFIPSEHLRSMRWLEPELDRVILDAHAELRARSDPERQKQIGDAAEQIVLAGLRWANRDPIHVAAISDRFGYDIEVPGPQTERIEVKAASTRTRGSFHLSRNEFDASRAHGQEWTLIQVVLDSAAFVEPHLNGSHVNGIYQLETSALDRIVPSDSPEFLWESSAVITAHADLWTPSRVPLHPELRLPGLGMKMNAK